MNARTSPVELTNICVICDGDRILVENKIGHGICFPGGHVEPGESMEASGHSGNAGGNRLDHRKPQASGHQGLDERGRQPFPGGSLLHHGLHRDAEILRGRPGLLGHKGGICGNGCYLEHEGCPAHLRR